MTVYRPLAQEQHEIRLLRLLPESEEDGGFSSPLRGELLYRYLASASADHGDYEALTYFWGDAKTDLQEITLDDSPTPVPITRNLELALRNLRLPDAHRTLWVDALCINQSDLPERSHQVSLMKDVYARCTRDIAYLGPYRHGNDNENAGNGTTSDPDEEEELLVRRGMTWLRHAANQDLAALSAMATDVGSRRRPYRDDRHSWSLSRDDSRCVRAVVKSPRIWSRVWVMQELACAPDVLLVHGRQTMGWEVLGRFLGDRPWADAFHLPFGHGERGGLVPELLHIVQSIEHQRSIIRKVGKKEERGNIDGEKEVQRTDEQVDQQQKSEEKEGDDFQVSLLDVLARFKNVHSTDPRDRIYGLLGLVTEKHGIRVDYERPVAHVFADVALYLINSLANLDIICQNPWTTSDPIPRALDGDGGLSSWIPDFADESYAGRNDDAGFARLLFAQRDIFAAGRPTCAVPATATATVSGLRIRLRGARVGRLGPVRHLEHHSPEHEYYRGLHTAAQTAMRSHFGDGFLQAARQYAHGGRVRESAMTAFWRTLTMDCTAYPIRRLGEGGVARCAPGWEFLLSYDGGFLENGDDYDEATMDEDQREKYAPIQAGGWTGRLEVCSMWNRNQYEWTFTVAQNGLFCMVRSGAREGDVIAVLDGGKVPVILRERDGVEGGEKDYVIVCMAYAHGYMDGEAFDRCEAGDLIEEEFLVA